MTLGTRSMRTPDITMNYTVYMIALKVQIAVFTESMHVICLSICGINISKNEYRKK